MESSPLFFIVFAILLACVILCDLKYFMLRDVSIATRKPYSFSRVQLTWWTLIILSSFITIILSNDGRIPTFHPSTLILLGISAATTASGRIIDVSDQTNQDITTRSQDESGQNFFLDILSDEKGVSIYRFQTVAFTLIFGVWFIFQVLNKPSGSDINSIMPDIENNNLILMGMSSGVYAAMKTTENKAGASSLSTNSHPEFVPNEAGGNREISQG